MRALVTTGRWVARCTPLLTHEPHGELEFMFTHEVASDTFDCDFSYH